MTGTRGRAHISRASSRGPQWRAHIGWASSRQRNQPSSRLTDGRNDRQSTCVQRKPPSFGPAALWRAMGPTVDATIDDTTRTMAGAAMPQSLPQKPTDGTAGGARTLRRSSTMALRKATVLSALPSFASAASTLAFTAALKSGDSSPHVWNAASTRMHCSILASCVLPFQQSTWPLFF